MTTDNNTEIRRVSAEALDVLTEIAARASSELSGSASGGAGSLASINTFTDGAAVSTLNNAGTAIRRSLEVIAQEPAIARIVVGLEDGGHETYYITRDTPPSASPGKKLAARNSPFGRVASLDVGDSFEISTPSGTVYGTVVERGVLRPEFLSEGWDSKNSLVSGAGYGPLTIVSMRGLLEGQATLSQASDELERIMAEANLVDLVITGRQRDVIAKMALRDQPILDKYQDEIFRLPLSARLMIVGPPGTGKTTTLIRRLGQKTDSQYLSDAERRSVASAVYGDINRDHSLSWVMFTPTNLLKLYLRDAFNNENIATPGTRISTWARYRLDVAKNKFRILRGASTSGRFTLKEVDFCIQPHVLTDQIGWYEDFFEFQSDEVIDDLLVSASELSQSRNAALSNLGAQISQLLRDTGGKTASTVIASFLDLQDIITELLEAQRNVTDAPITRELTMLVNRDKTFLTDFARFLSSLTAVEDEGEDIDDDEEESAQGARTPVHIARNAYFSNVRSQARNRLNRRSFSKDSRAARIAQWLGDRRPSGDKLMEIGESLGWQVSLRKFSNPIQRYLNGIPGRYRRFRRVRQAANLWYLPDGIPAGEIGGLELDVVLLCSLREAASFASDRGIRRVLERSIYTAVREMLDLTQNQVLVDEATDFSPIQLACMYAITSPTIRSFVASGDFNQRVTKWGSRSVKEMEWAIPGIEIRPITISYRHSRQLSEFALNLIELSGSETSIARLPDDISNEGFAPSLGLGLWNGVDEARWLADRIIEVARHTIKLPSVAVLVHDEANVIPVTNLLKRALEPFNINVVACTNGEIVGEDDDVRVFDVQHIKGLEFEAVFFVGIDRLAVSSENLFDKYLYVGATRAATFLGVTCSGPELPKQIAALTGEFGENWAF